MLSLTFRALSMMAPCCLSSLTATLYPSSHHLTILSFGIAGLPAVACTTSVFPAHTPLFTPLAINRRQRHGMVSEDGSTCCKGAGHAFVSFVKRNSSNENTHLIAMGKRYVPNSFLYLTLHNQGLISTSEHTVLGIPPGKSLPCMPSGGTLSPS